MSGRPSTSYVVPASTPSTVGKARSTDTPEGHLNYEETIEFVQNHFGEIVDFDSLTANALFDNNALLYNEVGRLRCPGVQCVDRSFHPLCNYKTHLRNHTGERPFACDQCAQRFRQRTHLQTHRRSMHDAKKPYKCEECGKTYSQITGMKAHMIRSHMHLLRGRGKTTNLRVPSLRCARCSVFFADEAVMARHACTPPQQRRSQVFVVREHVDEGEKGGSRVVEVSVSSRQLRPIIAQPMRITQKPQFMIVPREAKRATLHFNAMITKPTTKVIRQAIVVEEEEEVIDLVEESAEVQPSTSLAIKEVTNGTNEETPTKESPPPPPPPAVDDTSRTSYDWLLHHDFMRSKSGHAHGNSATSAGGDDSQFWHNWFVTSSSATKKRQSSPSVAEEGASEGVFGGARSMRTPSPSNAPPHDFSQLETLKTPDMKRLMR